MEPDLNEPEPEPEPEPNKAPGAEEGIPPVGEDASAPAQTVAAAGMRPAVPLPRDRWQRDEDAPACGNCGHAFNMSMYWRRHHCRHCGKLFCGNCVKARHTFASPSRKSAEESLRVCVECKAWLVQATEESVTRE